MTGTILLERAKKIADAVIEKLGPYCKKIEVAGSVRRKKQYVNDIDFVLIPSDWWNLNAELKKLGQAKAAGPKIMRIMAGATQLDFYFATDETWSTLLLIRTGSTENNKRLCMRAQELGMKLHADGSGLMNREDKRIAGDSEFSIYTALGLPYQEPKDRD